MYQAGIVAIEQKCRWGGIDLGTIINAQRFANSGGGLVFILRSNQNFIQLGGRQFSNAFLLNFVGGWQNLMNALTGLSRYENYRHIG